MTTAKKDMLPAAVNSIKIFNDYFGKYAYDDLDVVICSFAYGGMESPAFVRIKDEYALNSEDMTESQRMHHLIESLVHEIAHEWFYSAVGNDQYTEAWLDEGFATFATLVYREKTGEPKKETDETGSTWQNAWKSGKSLKIDLPYSGYEKAEDPTVPAEYRYTFSVYSGGASFLFELRTLMGEEDFQALVRDWYSSNLHKEVTTKQFLETVSKKAENGKANELFKKYFSKENIPAA